MSNKLAMRATDKAERRLSIKVETTVKIEKRARAAGLKFATMANAILDEAVANDEWTEADELRARAIIDENIRKRAADKAKKGIA